MKISHAPSTFGSVLLATMIFVLAIAAFMAAYLYVVENSNQSVHRAEAWNSALPITEAGIEEGLANLNQTAIVTNSTATSFSPFSRDLDGGTYFVGSSASGIVSTIISTGVVSAPISGDAIPRAVKVTAQRQALFSKGIVSMTFIDMNGNGPSVDSYDSSDPSKSNNGHFDPDLPPGTNGDVAALDGIVDFGNHSIYGNLYLGPNAVFKKGSVKGTTYADWNAVFPNAALPTDSDGKALYPLPAPTSTNGSYYYFTNSGYYYISDSKPMVVETNVLVTLDVRTFNWDPAGLTINGGTTNSGTLVAYQEAGSLTLGGSSSGGAFNNRPENFVYFGLPDVTKITFGGDSDFVGVIYAPQADLVLNGGGNAVNLIGSVVVKSVTMNGHYNFHYDTSLLGYYYGYYVVSSWREL